MGLKETGVSTSCLATFYPLTRTMENFPSSIEDLSFSISNYAFVSDLSRRFGVDAGQLV